MRCDFRTCSGNSHLLRNECVALIRKGWTNVKDFLAPSLVAPSLVAPSLVAPSLVAPSLGAPSLGLGACSFLRRGIAQQHLRPWVYLRGISAVGIPAMVPFRDRITGTHDRRSAGAGMDAAVGRGARLHRDVGGARDRHPPRRIRARGAAAYRGDTINSRRLDRLAEAAPPLGRTVA